MTKDLAIGLREREPAGEKKYRLKQRHILRLIRGSDYSGKYPDYPETDENEVIENTYYAIVGKGRCTLDSLFFPFLADFHNLKPCLCSVDA